MAMLKNVDKIVTIRLPMAGIKFSVVAFNGEESLSTPFSFRVHLLSKDGPVDARDLPGRNMDIMLRLANGSTRTINGRIQRFHAGAEDHDGRCIYHVEIVPWFQLLQLHSQCRIFQDMDTMAIIEQVFNEHGYSDYVIQKRGVSRLREYTVQYRESDFDFVSRLLGEEGMYYFFTQESGKHTMVITDSSSALVRCVEYKARFGPDNDSKTELSEWAQEYSLGPEATDRVSGAGCLGSFTAGGKFVPIGERHGSQRSQEYTLVRVNHSAAEGTYRNHFDCVPVTETWHPFVTTSRPTIPGPQLATVVGPAGEDTYTDEYGRVKVQFYWDEADNRNESSSCWLPVSQQQAGPGWGAMFLPRIGHEVVVNFLDGDPDRPIVSGCVYNADHQPPWSLPGHSTRSGWKTSTTRGDRARNFNELRFDDREDGEEIYLHAGKDLQCEVKGQQGIHIGTDRLLQVDGSETVTIGKKQVTSIGKDQRTTVEGRRNIHVSKNDDLRVDKKLTIEAGDQIEFKVGKAGIVLRKDGTIIIKGKNISQLASGKIIAKSKHSG